MFFLKQLLSSNKDLLIYVLILVLIGAWSWFCYSSGSKHIQAKWDAETVRNQQAMMKLEAEYEAKHQILKENQEKEVNELKDKILQYEKTSSVLKSSLNSKLQQSESRSKVYKRQAESSEAERRSLAIYTARLDKALTEGIQLVEELSATIKLRDEQLKFIRKYIEDTNKLLGN